MEKIYVFGRGEYFKNKSATFLKEFEIEGFLDNSVAQTDIDGTYGIKVYNPSYVNSLPEYPIYCVATDFIGMWQQLIGLGVADERIRFGVDINPKQSGLEKTAFSHGEKLYSQDNELIYLCGDVKYRIASIDEFKKIIRDVTRERSKDISSIASLSTSPVSRTFGSDRGTAVDRFYIEKFLKSNSDYIKGTVMEVANNNYTIKFGKDNVTKSIICHVMGWGKDAIKVNFETGEGVRDEMTDCLICTQTLQYIFDLKTAMENIYRMLKPGGVALITVPGIKPLCEYDNNQWGEHWSFTEKSMDKLCSLVCSKENYEVKQYGNVKSATAYLYGVCLEDINEEELEVSDSQFPFIISARIRKEG